MAESVCEECGKVLVQGLTRCGACGPRPTPARLLLPSLLCLVLGAPTTALGAVVFVGGVQMAGQAQLVLGFLLFAALLGLTAVIGGGVDLVRALVALARGQELCRPLGLRWVLEAFARGDRKWV